MQLPIMRLRHYLHQVMSGVMSTILISGMWEIIIQKYKIPYQWHLFMLIALTMFLLTVVY